MAKEETSVSSKKHKLLDGFQFFFNIEELVDNFHEIFTSRL
jgi:hypothetical protein